MAFDDRGAGVAAIQCLSSREHDRFRQHEMNIGIGNYDSLYDLVNANTIQTGIAGGKLIEGGVSLTSNQERKHP